MELIHASTIVLLNLVLFGALGFYIVWLFKQSNSTDRYQAWLMLFLFVLLVLREVTAP